MPTHKTPFGNFKRPKRVCGISGRSVNIDFRYLRIVLRNKFPGGAFFRLNYIFDDTGLFDQKIATIRSDVIITDSYLFPKLFASVGWGLMERGVVLVNTSKEPVCPRVELILKIIIILLIIFLGFIKSKPC